MYGPIYTHLVKEFRRFANTDKRYIVSYVLGKKIIISKKSITALLGIERVKGKRVSNTSYNSKFLKKKVIPTIFIRNEGNMSKGTSCYKNRELDDKYRIWVKIILGCIHPRNASSSVDYVNSDQKFILYYIMKGIKVNLLYLPFN